MLIKQLISPTLLTRVVLFSSISGMCQMVRHVIASDCGLQEMGASFKVGDIPEDLLESALEWREKLLEQVAEMDDDVMEKYLDVSCQAAVAACPVTSCET